MSVNYRTASIIFIFTEKSRIFEISRDMFHAEKNIALIIIRAKCIIYFIGEIILNSQKIVATFFVKTKGLCKLKKIYFVTE